MTGQTSAEYYVTGQATAGNAAVHELGALQLHSSYDELLTQEELTTVLVNGDDQLFPSLMLGMPRTHVTITICWQT